MLLKARGDLAISPSSRLLASSARLAPSTAASIRPSESACSAPYSAPP